MSELEEIDRLLSEVGVGKEIKIHNYHFNQKIRLTLPQRLSLFISRYKAVQAYAQKHDDDGFSYIAESDADRNFAYDNDLFEKEQW